MKAREITNDCIVLAFYGLTADAACMPSLFTDVTNWFSAVQCPTSKLSVHGRGYSGKPSSYPRVHAQVLSKGWADAKAFTVFSVTPGGVIPSLDWWAIASLDLGVGTRPYFALAARASVSTLNDDHLAKLIASCVSSLKPAYGIGCHRNHDQGPWFFAAGVNYGVSTQESPTGYEDALAVSRWGDLGMVEEVYKSGLLRNVYEINFLSEPHLRRQVDGSTLREWITNDPSRGTLNAMSEGIVMWKVQDSFLSTVRHDLRDAGCIFDWRKFLNQ